MGVRTMEVQIEYDLIQQNCNTFTAENIMDEVGNTLKKGLVAATTTITIGILNGTYPRTESEGRARRKAVRARRLQRGLARIGSPTAPSSPTDHTSQRRNLVYYTNEKPVTITRILDIFSGVPIGQKKILVISSIPVTLEQGDDPDVVKKVIASGFQKSVSAQPTPGLSFFGAIPAGTVDCPKV